MFSISGKRNGQKEMIDKVANINVGAGIILAVTDFEWTLIRSILVLGKTPTVELRDKLLNKSTKFDKIEAIWNEEIKAQPLKKLFDEWQSPDGQKPVEWNDIKAAREVRNILVHSGESSVDDETAHAIIRLLEKACDILCAFAKTQGKELYDRLTPRPRKRGEGEYKSKTRNRWREVHQKCAGFSQKY